MPYIGIRTSEELHRAIKKMAESQNRSMSDIIRQILETHVIDFFTTEQVEWKILLWSIFNVDTHKINFALSNSSTAAEFFALFSKWLKNHKLSVHYIEDTLHVSLHKGEKIITSYANVRQPKETIISSIVVDIESKIMEDIADDL